MVALTLLVIGALGAVVMPGWAELIAIMAVVFGNGYAAFLMIRRSGRLDEKEQQAWRFMGLGFAISSLGVLAGVATAMIVGSIPAFSGFDFVILGGYVFFVTGLALLPGGGGDWRERAQRIIDGVVVSLSIAAILAAIVLEDIFLGLAEAPTFDRWVGSAYPLLDTAGVVSIGIVFVRRRQYRFDVRLVLIAIGLTLQAAADLSFLSTATGVSFAEATPNFAMFTAAVFFYVAAAEITDRMPAAREVSDRHTPIWSLVAPYGAAAGMFVLLAMEILADGDQHTLMLFPATFLVGSLVFARQALAIRENRILVEHERTALISSLSHELRTPLTSLVGFLSVLDDDGELLTAGERIDIISTTRQQADYMGRMVTDLVMLARDDLDSVEIDVSAEVLAELVERSIVSSDIPRRGLTVDVNERLLVSVDCDRIQQVLVNLLTNANRYGSGEITLAATSQGADLFLSVHDNGAGVPKKHQITMWERFERAHHRFNASIPGSGIGLSIVDSLVKAHDGRVTYRTSELLGGACFMIELPGAVLPHAPAVRESVDSPQMAAGSTHTRAAS